MGVQPIYDKGPRPLSRTGTRAARGKITSGISYRLDYCEIFIVYMYIRFTNVTANCTVRPGGPRVGYPRFGRGNQVRQIEMTPHNAITGIL